MKQMRMVNSKLVRRGAAVLRTRDSGGYPGWGLPLPWRDHRGVKNTTCLSASGGFGTRWAWCSLSLLKEAPLRMVP